MRLTDTGYENIKKAVVNMFIVNDIRQIPIDCFEICRKMCIKLRKYSSLTKDALVKAKQVSEDGFCMLLKEVPAHFESYQWYIFYDDTKSRVGLTEFMKIPKELLDAILNMLSCYLPIFQHTTICRFGDSLKVWQKIVG